MHAMIIQPNHREYNIDLHSWRSDAAILPTETRLNTASVSVCLAYYRMHFGFIYQPMTTMTRDF